MGARQRAWRLVLAGTMLLATGARAAPQGVITGARYSEPTARYQHGVFGNDTEWGALILTVKGCAGCDDQAARKVTIRLAENRVFEDNAPRIFTGNDGLPLVMVVETDLELGARLAVYDETGLVAATPFIGRPQRWLAPVGAADLDGDGLVELAWVDRPHLARVLRVWRLTDSGLREVAFMENLSNHQFGWAEIPGGIRDCGAGPEMILATGDWRRVMAVRLAGGKLAARSLGDYTSPADLNRAMACRK